MYQQNQMNNCNMMNNPMNPNIGVMGGTGPMMGNQNMGMGMNNMGMGMNNNMGMGMNNNMGMGMNNMNNMNNMGMGMNNNMGMGMNNNMGMGMNNNMGMGMNNMNNMGMGMNNMNQMGSNTMGPMGMNNMMNNMGMGMNNQMGMNQMFMNSMGPMGMNNMMANMAMMQGMMQMQKAPMTEEQKKQLRMQGYLMGKKMAEERKKQNAANNPNPTPTVQEGPATGELTIKFKKGGSVTTIKMDAGSMVAELINEYFVKSHTTAGKFKYNNIELSISDTSTLAEAGLKNNAEISVI